MKIAAAFILATFLCATVLALAGCSVARYAVGCVNSPNCN